VDAFFDEVEVWGLVGIEGGREMWVGVGHEFEVLCCRDCGGDARRGG
jgi:hypothetical protein